MLWALGESRREVEWPFARVQADGPDGQFLHNMTVHHEVGLYLSELAAEHAADTTVRTLGELMASEHQAEIALMRQWWQSWFASEMPDLSNQEHHAMVGMSPPQLLEELEGTQGVHFEQLFLPVMIHHHEGAIVMCNEVLQQGHDPRNYLLAWSIRHTQLNQMEQMRRLLRERSSDGSAAVPYTW